MAPEDLDGQSDGRCPYSSIVRAFACLLAPAIGFVVVICPCEEIQAADKLAIRIDSGATYQTIDGFGASDAWRCQFVGKNWPLEKRERIADLLFGRETDAQGNPRGIGLSIWRFYLSAGTAEQGDASNIQNPWRRGECFQSPDGTYDWAKLAGQQWFLRAARDRGVERFLAFSNAPPVHLSKNGKGYATPGNIQLNVKPDCLDDYADYLVDVVDHFQKQGLPFDYLSPVNEPQWNWDEPGQEGTPALNEEISALVRRLSYRLSTRGLKTRILIGEAGSINHAVIPMTSLGMASDGRDDQARFFFDKQSPFYIGGLPNVENTISAHSYHTVWPVDQQVECRQRVHEVLKSVNPDLGYWMSEYCILQPNEELRGGRRRDLGMSTALYVARIIHHDLTLAHARSWQWWTALTQVDYKDGLVYLDDGSEGDSGRMGGHVESLVHDGIVRESKLLWALGNYSRFVRPGMKRVRCDVQPVQSPVDGLLASAYQGAADKIIVVLVNLAQDEALCDLGSGRKAAVYTTSETSSLRKSEQPSSEITIPARSVATVCFEAP